MRFLQKHLFLTATHEDIFFPFPLTLFRLHTQRLCQQSSRRSVVASV